jgi:hypothetical protein
MKTDLTEKFFEEISPQLRVLVREHEGYFMLVEIEGNVGVCCHKPEIV